MTSAEKRKRSRARYNRSHDTIGVMVSFGRKEEIREHAARYQPETGDPYVTGGTLAGSMSAFINRAIDEAMERDIAQEQSALERLNAIDREMNREQIGQKLSTTQGEYIESIANILDSCTQALYKVGGDLSEDIRPKKRLKMPDKTIVRKI